MKTRNWIVGSAVIAIVFIVLFFSNPSAKRCEQLSTFDSFVVDPFNSDVGIINQNNQKEASVVAELIDIGEPEFQVGKFESSNYKRELTFKGNIEQKTLTYVFPDNINLRGLGKNDSLLDILEIGKTYQLNLLANPPSPTVSIYLIEYKSFNCN